MVGDPLLAPDGRGDDGLVREREGATFTGAAGGFNEGFAVLLFFVLLWLGVGVLIVWGQPHPLGGGGSSSITGLGFPLSLAQPIAACCTA